MKVSEWRASLSEEDRSFLALYNRHKKKLAEEPKQLVQYCVVCKVTSRPTQYICVYCRMRYTQLMKGKP